MTISNMEYNGKKANVKEKIEPFERVQESLTLHANAKHKK